MRDMRKVADRLINDEGKTQKQAAAMLGVPEGTVAYWRQKARNPSSILGAKNATKSKAKPPLPKPPRRDNRKKLTGDERDEIVEAVAKGKTQQRPKAKERQKEHGKTAPGRASLGGISPKCPEREPRAADAAAAAVGWDRRTFEKAARLTGASPADGGLLIAVTWRYRNGWDGSGEGNTNQRRRRSVGW